MKVIEVSHKAEDAPLVHGLHVYYWKMITIAKPLLVPVLVPLCRRYARQELELETADSRIRSTWHCNRSCKRLQTDVLTTNPANIVFGAELLR